MVVDPPALPNDIETLKAAWLEQHARAKSAHAAYARIVAELANEQPRRADDTALIVHMKLQMLQQRRRDEFADTLSAHQVAQINAVLSVKALGPNT